MITAAQLADALMAACGAVEPQLTIPLAYILIGKEELATLWPLLDGDPITPSSVSCILSFFEASV